MSLEKMISDILADFWLNRNPYCGMSATGIHQKLQESGVKATFKEIEQVLIVMERDGKLSIRQLEDDFWINPKKKLLEPYDIAKEEEIGIYTKQLRLGGSQIEHRFFRRQVLDRYKQDPRYRFEEWDYAGSIFIEDEPYHDPSVPEADKISIQYFGIAYTDKDEKVVAVILDYLGDLSVEHQRYWSSFEIHERCLLDSDYVKTNFGAEFSGRMSIFMAFTQELEEINKICSLIDEPPLFKETFINNSPAEFNWLTKPTATEYNLFIHALDKTISENINKTFFVGKIQSREEVSQKGGKIKVVEKGSIRLLEEYLAKYWQFPNPKPKDDMIETFKRIRKMRQRPAHKAIEDKYDFEFNQKQRDLIRQAYVAVRTLRLLLTNHPRAKSYVPPDWLQRGWIG